MTSARIVGYQAKRTMNVIAVYFDDSGTHAGSEVVVYSGLLGTVEQWALFEAAWKTKLKTPYPGKPPLKRFHMAPCVAGKNEFLGYSTPERNTIIHDFRQIIIDSGVYGTTATVPVALWDEFITGNRREKAGNAETECFNAAVNIALSFISTYTNDQDASLIFDRAPGREDFQKSVVDKFANFFAKHESPVRLHGPTFLSSYEAIPLQAADMIAWESNFLARAGLKETNPEPRPEFAEIIDSHRFLGALMNRENILEYAAYLDAEA